MNESYENNEVKEIEEISSIEQQANYEGNHTLLFLERVSNPPVFDKIVDNLYEDISTRDMSTFSGFEKWDLEEKNKVFALGELEVKKYIRSQLNENLNQISTSTGIEYSPIGSLSSHCIAGKESVGILQKDSPHLENIGYQDSDSLKDMTSAHEKGHVLRQYHPDSLFSKNLNSVFDFEKITPSDEELEEHIKIDEWYINRTGSKLTQEERNEIISDIKEYQSLPHEIIERMAQLKNYFGMKRDEEFTVEHLDYAKKNYIKDTGILSIQISPFLEAISNKEEFVNLMNTLGI